ncbi:MAG: DUF1294 domain-containing protein [Clostridiaceae bacterium]|nr:DUF1294 domain-containing protein [Clostridiaceae bacterium]
MPFFSEFILIYLALMAVVAVTITAVDKRAAIKGRRRVPESTLMIVGLFGGALPMYVTMKVIRHKTKHKKFMIGLPLEIAIHAALVCLGVWLYFNK